MTQDSKKVQDAWSIGSNIFSICTALAPKAWRPPSKKGNAWPSTLCFDIFSCPGSSILDLGQSVSESLTHCHFRVLTQRVTFETWDPSDIWSEWCLDKNTKRQKYKNTKRQNDKMTKRQKDTKTKDKEQQLSSILRRQGSFALLQCFLCSFLFSLFNVFHMARYTGVSKWDTVLYS